MADWQVQTAKQRLSEVLRAAEAGEPQFITRHGNPVAVIIDIADYRASHEHPDSLVDFLLGGPDLGEIELPERIAEPERPLDLSAS